MEPKTKIQATPGKQDLVITRTFDLPLELLFRAYVDSDIVAQWMGTNVLQLDSRKFGQFRFETTDPKGNKHRFSGTIHECEPNRKITRTFEMENTPFPVQLEFLAFEQLPEGRSHLSIHIIYKSVDDRDAMLKLPFSFGLNMAHDRLQEICSTFK